jgi:pyrrolysine biosynthesis protein PylC
MGVGMGVGMGMGMGHDVKVLVLGGQLQGTEITYLAKECGWHVTVVDRNEDVLASGLCDEFICTDLLESDWQLFSGYDLVFPAIENAKTLMAASDMAALAGVPFAFDRKAYMLSRSKIQTNRFLRELGIRIPPLIEDCLAPGAGYRIDYIVKPDCNSGSKGVRRFDRAPEALNYICRHQGVFGQAFLGGPIYSIEVVCDHQSVALGMVTEVVVGSNYDCHQIVAPADIPLDVTREIRSIALKIGQALNMKGIFDIEMVFHDSGLYVLEIDARMPSQTPISIYHACDINLVAETARCFLSLPDLPTGLVAEVDTSGAGSNNADTNIGPWRCSHVVLQHLVRQEQDAIVRLIGEGQLTDSPPLQRMDGYCGADIALVGEDARRGHTYATLIAIERSNQLAAEKMSQVITEFATGRTTDDKIIGKRHHLHQTTPTEVGKGV